jgi:phosphoglycerate dehydrogenase-like enzyme
MENKTIVLALLQPQTEDARQFSQALYANLSAELGAQVELRMARAEYAAKIDLIQDAEVVVCGNLSAELLAEAKHLNWVCFWSAGMDNKVTPEMLARNLLLTSSNGIHGPNIAEHVLMFMLMFARQMPYYLRMQTAGRWERSLPQDQQRADRVFELNGQTLGIVGLGRIGEALTVRAKACGMRVVALKRDPQARYDSAVQPDALYGPEQLPQLLQESDHVCIALPYTPQTHHLFNADALAHMKPTAYLYNIARGKIVDEAALIAALQAGRLAGAGLDVFETEPLPADSPLWQMENVILTPHISGLTPHYFARAAELFAANLKRYRNGQPHQNLYDPARGY